MKVSILMPIYNRIEFLQESLSSIKRQTHKDLELLIGFTESRLSTENRRMSTG